MQDKNYLKIPVFIALLIVSMSCRNQAAFEDLRNYYRQADISYLNNIGKDGIGVVNPNDFSFHIYLDSEGKQSLFIENIEEQEYVIPLVHKPDYALFYMIASGESETYYEVYLNEETVGYVRKDEVKFYSWPDFYLKTICIKTEKAYTRKDDAASEIVFPDENCLKVIEVEGDWLVMVEEYLYEDEDIVGETIYYLKWRDQSNNLLVYPIFLM